MKDTRPCEVCVIIDKDQTPKIVEWCEFCGAWICDGCWSNETRRLKALTLRTIEAVKKFYKKKK